MARSHPACEAGNPLALGCSHRHPVSSRRLMGHDQGSRPGLHSIDAPRLIRMRFARVLDRYRDRFHRDFFAGRFLPDSSHANRIATVSVASVAAASRTVVHP